MVATSGRSRALQESYLGRIVEDHRRRAQVEARDMDKLAALAGAMAPTRGFRAALSRQGEVTVIAEVKRCSPSKGQLKPDLDPAILALAYEVGGAGCLSVLTDSEFFGGSSTDLQAARSATALPVLRKDFTVSEADVCDARLMGADAVLLIVAALDTRELGTFVSLAEEIGIDALVEVHDEEELEQALAAGASLVGVNQRDLFTFQVDSERALRMAEVMPEGVVTVAESGITGPGDVWQLGRAGYDAVLVGEAVVTATDPTAAVAALVASGRAG